MAFLQRIKYASRILFSLPMTLWFNFRFLPFKQAVKLPVWFYRPKFYGKGKYRIEGKVYPGMIRMGFPMVTVFREKGVVLENRGEIVFKGSVRLGGGSGISVGSEGMLIIGDKFCNQTGGKIVCYHKVLFGDKVRLGWDVLVCDTDFHTMRSEDGSRYTKGYGPIEVMDDVWVGSYCKIFKNTVIPQKCTVGANSVISKKIECRPYSLIYTGSEIKVKYTGYCRDVDDDRINYVNEREVEK